MAFPPGVQTVMVNPPANGYRTLDGEYQQGTITLTPTVSEVVSAEHGIIAVGAINFTIGASGSFTPRAVLPNDADDFLPTGWTYRLDQNLTGETPRSYNVLIPASAGSVDVSTLVEVEASDGIIVSVPGGGHGTPSDTVTAETSYGQAAAAGASTDYSRGDHTHGTPNLPPTGTTLGTYAAGNDARLSDARTPTAHAATHTAAGSDPLTLSQSQITGLLSALAALLPLAGGTMTGDLTLDGHNLTIKRADGTGAYRLRVTGGGLDFEIAGLDVFLSQWSNADFTGTQSNVLRLEAAGPHLIGDAQFGTGAFDAVHSIDAGSGVASLGAKNGLVNVQFCGRRSSPGAPTTGTWAAGDTVQDSAGVLWLCTAGGTPGAWTGGTVSKPWVFDVTASAYGAVGDAQVVADGAMGSGSAVLTSATAAFVAGDVGKAISVKGAGPNGVTTLVTTIASRQSATQVTLAAANASGGAVSGAVVIWGTDDTAAIQAAVDAAEAYLTTHTYAQVWFPPLAYALAGPLNNTKSGNGQIAFGPYAMTGDQRTLHFAGAGIAAPVRSWLQTVPVTSGACLISLGVYSSTSAQISNINADGNPAVLCGPNEGWGYGVAANFSNMMASITNLSIVTTHSSFGLTYGAVNFWGCAKAYIDGLSYGTAGTVASPSTDYNSPGVFGTGLSAGCLLPAPGNNDHVKAPNISCNGGYTYAMFATEHLDMGRYMALYCWAGIVIVGTYAGSVGSVHAMKVASASIEACINEVYILGAGSGGIGPIIHIDQLSTESSTPNVAGQAAHMAAARGKICWTGIFTEAGLTHDQPTGIESENGQAISAVRAVTASTTARPIDRVIKADASSGGITVNLPSAAPNPVTYTIIKADVSGNTVTIDPAGAETVNGSATRVLSAQWETVTLRSDGSNWIAI